MPDQGAAKCDNSTFSVLPRMRGVRQEDLRQLLRRHKTGLITALFQCCLGCTVSGRKISGNFSEGTKRQGQNGLALPSGFEAAELVAETALKLVAYSATVLVLASASTIRSLMKQPQGDLH